MYFYFHAVLCTTGLARKIIIHLIYCLEGILGFIFNLCQETLTLLTRHFFHLLISQLIPSKYLLLIITLNGISLRNWLITSASVVIILGLLWEGLQTLTTALSTPTLPVSQYLAIHSCSVYYKLKTSEHDVFEWVSSSNPGDTEGNMAHW